jgi:hypothetical protein
MGDAFMQLPIETRRKIIALAREHREKGYNEM